MVSDQWSAISRQPSAVSRELLAHATGTAVSLFYSKAPIALRKGCANISLRSTGFDAGTDS
ncbi:MULTISPECIES: hypothetical protein [unclassified Moorena]|uniref:hypothetical protein n=1 Tax=unclassified Moorena TaxID=2683338 RepID=UPI001400B512|nr:MULTISPECIES: hypothetical protein [unclassified Moorena]NEO12487.1 hypothetical protein [Moorena sp. SIO3E8]NEP99326.1 hypothetical protein [Moorena sp. SIO3F7]